MEDQRQLVLIKGELKDLSSWARNPS